MTNFSPINVFIWSLLDLLSVIFNIIFVEYCEVLHLLWGNHWLGNLVFRIPYFFKTSAKQYLFGRNNYDFALDCKEIKPVNPEVNNPEYSLEGLMLKL